MAAAAGGREARGNASITARYFCLSLQHSFFVLSRAGLSSRLCSVRLIVQTELHSSVVECSMQSEEHSLLDSTASAGAAHAALVDGSSALARVARLCEGLSGRAIRKLPFLAHTQLGASPAATKQGCPLGKFLAALHRAAQLEVSDRECMASRGVP